jgi:hypothetical protein
MSKTTKFGPKKQGILGVNWLKNVMVVVTGLLPFDQ